MAWRDCDDGRRWCRLTTPHTDARCASYATHSLRIRCDGPERAWERKLSRAISADLVVFVFVFVFGCRTEGANSGAAVPSPSYTLGHTGFPPTISTSCDWGIMQARRGEVSVLRNSNFGVGKGGWVTNYGSEYPVYPYVPRNLQLSRIFSAMSLDYSTPVSGTTCYKAEIAASLSGGVFLNYFQRASFQPQVARPSFRTLANADIKPLVTGYDIPDDAPQARAIGFPNLPRGVELTAGGGLEEMVEDDLDIIPIGW
ncbi:hypothetical protein H4582DRAFT_2062034 [Lactarius indigo]|nr:hypothetical protein H4582DRAFT_2062034 [Lactarius indigo]